MLSWSARSLQRIVHIQSPVKNAYQSHISGVKIRETRSYNPRNITHAAVIKPVTLSVLSLLSSSNYSSLTVICANRWIGSISEYQ